MVVVGGWGEVVEWRRTCCICLCTSLCSLKTALPIAPAIVGLVGSFLKVLYSLQSLTTPPPPPPHAGPL